MGDILPPPTAKQYGGGFPSQPSSEMLNRLHEVLEALLEQWECRVVEFNGEADHIHLLFQYHPGIELSKLVNNIKTVSSRKLRQEFSEQVDRFYHKDVLWNGSYFIASCGGVTISEAQGIH